MAELDGFDDGLDGEAEESADGALSSGDGGGGDGDGDEEPLILIVVGAHLRAEVGDRPLAYTLRDRMVAWLDEHFPAKPAAEAEPAAAAEDEPEGGSRKAQAGRPYEVIVCTDVWYLNDVGLRVWPTVSVGGPGVNALSAFLGDKLPSVLVVDDVLMIQMDPDLNDLTAAIWGINHDATVAAVDAFIERYLDSFLTAATKAWG